MENYGTDPDVEVDVRPQDHVEGRDPQLDMAVELALAALREHRPLSADLAQRPRLELPTLPPRAATSGNGAAAPKRGASKAGAPKAAAPKGARKPTRKSGG